MTAVAGSRAGRAQTGGDIASYRVGALVAEHRETVKAMWAAIDARAEARAAEVAYLRRLVGAVDYATRLGVDPASAVDRVRRLVADHKASGLSTRGGEGAWCSPGGGRPAEVEGLRGPASTAGGTR